MSVTSNKLGFEVLSNACGAEITGVDLRATLDTTEIKFIRDVWLQHLVIVFRGQAISNEDQVRFCKYFGSLEEVRTGNYANEDMRHTMMITNVMDTGYKTALENGDMWFHSDQCYYEIPCRASSLYSMEVPSIGGNTLFANGYKAWDSLSNPLKAKLRRLRAVNVYDYNGNPLKRSDSIDPQAPKFSHPIARIHPDTGKYALYVNRLMTTHIEGMDQEESSSILNQLFDHSEKPEFIYEHVWKNGDLILWDNRCSMHARTDFDPKESRMLRRITIKGEPVQ
tara:strand:+ start:323 stop:1165 length:843 start_codon:yes stop_codon:yes gene_type:complete